MPSIYVVKIRYMKSKVVNYAVGTETKGLPAEHIDNGEGKL